MALRRLTEAEIAAANLRRMSRDLVLEAERLEASVVPDVPKQHSGPRNQYTCPVSGKKVTIDNSRRL